MKNYIFSSLVIGTLFCATTATAFNAKVCDGELKWWDDPTMTMQIDKCSTTSSQRSDFRAAANAWNSIRGVNDMIRLVDSTGCGVASGNDTHQMGIFSESSFGEGGLLGLSRITYQNCGWWWWEDGEIFEADIWIASDMDIEFGVVRAAESCADYCARDVIVHEIGHVIGMDHENAFPSVMNSNVGRGEVISMWGGSSSNRHGPWPDDVNFLMTWHANGNASTDVAPTPLVYNATTDSFSNPNPVIPRNWGNYISLDDTAVPFTQVCPGDVVLVQYNIANRGGGAVSVEHDLRLSTNDYISSFDMRVQIPRTDIIGRGGRVELPRGFIFPNVSPGWYYVGALADPDNDLDEWIEGNNGVPLMQVVVPGPGDC